MDTRICNPDNYSNQKPPDSDSNQIVQGNGDIKGHESRLGSVEEMVCCIGDCSVKLLCGGLYIGAALDSELLLSLNIKA